MFVIVYSIGLKRKRLVGTILWNSGFYDFDPSILAWKKDFLITFSTVKDLTVINIMYNCIFCCCFNFILYACSICKKDYWAFIDAVCAFLIIPHRAESIPWRPVKLLAVARANDARSRRSSRTTSSPFLYFDCKRAPKGNFFKEVSGNWVGVQFANLTVYQYGQWCVVSLYHKYSVDYDPVHVISFTTLMALHRTPITLLN